MPKGPTMSLCMIAKQEAENLPQCLASVARYVDEIHIADTGSTDDTIRVATKLGANVHLFTPDRFPDSFFRDDEATCSSFGAPPPYSNQIMLGDFGAARRFAFSFATCDYGMWLDADDVLMGGENLRATVEEMRARSLDLGFLAYNYAVDHKDRVHWRQWRERIILRGVANWVNPVHEVLLPSRPVTMDRFTQPFVQHRRKADRPGVANRNLKILLRQIHMDKQAGREVDPRTLFYAGNEMRFVDQAKAIAFYNEYLDKSGWPEERAAAHLAIGAVHECGGPLYDLRKAEREFAAAALCQPQNPDGCFAAARIAYYRKRWAECVELTERGMSLNNPESMLGANPAERAYRPFLFVHYALGQLGRYEEALAACIKGLEIYPDDPGSPCDGTSPGQLLASKSFYEARLRDMKAPPTVGEVLIDSDPNSPPAAVPNDQLGVFALQLWKLARIESPSKARDLLGALPTGMYPLPPIARAFQISQRDNAPTVVIPEEALKTYPILSGMTSAAYVPPDNELTRLQWIASLAKSQPLTVVIWTGPCIEWWCPRTPNERGLGGSETACIEIGRSLAKLGHKVTVYADCPHMDGVYDGVTYKHFGAFGGADCDVFISSRQPGAIEHTVQARAKFLWVHDVSVGPNDANMERWLLKYDRVLCLSNWHKDYFASCYPNLHPDRIIVTRNGIDPARFTKPLQREACRDCGGTGSRNIPHAGAKCDGCDGTGTCVCEWLPRKNWCVFSSSPNRGLDTLLDIWPAIRARVPDAELHVAYGFDTWEAFASRAGNVAELATIQHFKQRLTESVSRGVVNHGKMKQDELAQLFMRAKSWTAPTAFSETFCISAIEAQAAGCVPVTTKLAALAETVKVGFLLEPPNTDLRYREQFVEATVQMLTNESARKKFSDEARRRALAECTWDSVASEWDAMFRRVADEVSANPIPKFRSV